MQTRISTNGRVTLPAPIRRRLALQAGDSLDAMLDGEKIVLTPNEKRKKRLARKGKIVIDPISGFPALTLGPGAPALTGKEVKKMLSDFP